MRAYIVRHLFGIGAAGVVVVALYWGWPVYDGVAQADNAADDAILTVRTCIGANATSASLEEALIKEDIIEEDLLQTKVTNGMCKEMLKPITDGTPVRKLLAAQNYIQEINLIEGAMSEAAGEAATRGPDWVSSSDKPLIRFRTIGQTSEQVPALAQYDGTGDDGTGGIEPRKTQAAAAAGAGEDADDSIAERLRQKEAALKKEGASAPVAAAGGRCSLSVNILDEELDKGEGLYHITPLIPKKIGRGETKPAGLLVTPAAKERFQEIRRKNGAVAEASESDIGCVRLTDRMGSTLISSSPEELDVDRQQLDDIHKLSSNRSTRWGWDMTARQTGELLVVLDLRYAISQKSQEFRRIPDSPVYEGPIKATPPESDSTQKDTERAWWQRLLGGLSEWISRLF
jgi:hypothetical protein